MDQNNDFYEFIRRVFNLNKFLQRNFENQATYNPIISKKSVEDKIPIKITSQHFSNKNNSIQSNNNINSSNAKISAMQRVDSQAHNNIISEEGVNQNMEIYKKTKSETMSIRENNEMNTNNNLRPNKDFNISISNKSNNHTINESNKSINNSIINNKDNDEEFLVLNILEKLKINLKNFGRKSLLNLIKHFQHYDNGTKFINKSDFIKVIRDFRLNLTASEIEKIFDFYITDKKKQLINYENFIYIICPDLSDSNKNMLTNIFEDLASICNKSDYVELDILKFIYNPNYNPFGSDSSQALSEFVENLELHHFMIKKRKNNIITLEQFLEFYRYFAFYLENDQQFGKIITNEYSKINDFKLKTIKANISAKQQTERDENLKKAEVEAKNDSINQGRRDFFDINNNNNNRVNIDNQKQKNIHQNINQGVSGKLLKEKLENYIHSKENNLNINLNEDYGARNNNIKIIQDSNISTPANSFFNSNNNNNINEAEKNNFNRNNKFTKELKDKITSQKIEENLVNYVVNKNFKSNIDRNDARSELRSNVNNNQENKGIVNKIKNSKN